MDRSRPPKLSFNFERGVRLIARGISPAEVPQLNVSHHPERRGRS